MNRSIIDNRNMHPWIKHYQPDGTGKDFYVAYNNGGNTAARMLDP